MVIVHERVSERHPELTDDVRSAWENQYRWVLRERDAGLRRVAVGLDPNGRESWRWSPLSSRAVTGLCTMP